MNNSIKSFHTMSQMMLIIIALLAMSFENTKTKKYMGPHEKDELDYGCKCNEENCIPNCLDLKILTFNIWGVPKSPVLDRFNISSQYKKERIAEIAKLLSKGEYDLYLFQELLVETDYNIVRASMPEGFHITNFQDFSEPSPKCVLQYCLPLYCSGLTTISRYPIKNVKFDVFDALGGKCDWDLQYFGRKGMGIIQIEPMPNVTIDVINTHTHYNNTPNVSYHSLQISEIARKVKTSTADIVVLGGDINTDPTKYQAELYGNLVNETRLIYCGQEILGQDAWLSPRYKTYENPENSYKHLGHQTGMVLDYIFQRTNSPKKVQVRATAFDVPILKTSCKPMKNQLSKSEKNIRRKAMDQCPSVPDVVVALNYTECLSSMPTLFPHKYSIVFNWIDQTYRTKCESQEEISLSDHEAVTATIRIRKLGKAPTRVKFFTPEVGKLCGNPVNRNELCKMSSKWFPGTVYATLRGYGNNTDSGHHLPYGCILDAVSTEQRFIYWNPNGRVLSTDKNILQICYSTIS